MMAKLAKAQYEADQRIIGITIIHQLDHHIDRISKLFAAYGLPADGKPYAIRLYSTILQALENKPTGIGFTF